MSAITLHWWRTAFVLVPLVALYTIVCGTVSLVGGLFDGSGRFAHRVAQTWAQLILATSGVRVVREGVLPEPHQSSVFVANHSSFYDVPILFTALPRPSDASLSSAARRSTIVFSTRARA